ncbi:MAG TPA: LuxR C-terminal-related transcriptional regulator [Pseudolysinimonas sp.]|nr:LuxR C-terminal-related transcriptional regulator [Pseudolysinimonas sp.]
MRIAAAQSPQDLEGVHSMLQTSGYALALEGGAAFREVVQALPDDRWHTDPIICWAMGASFRGPGTPSAHGAIAYFQVAEAIVRALPDVFSNALVEVHTGHASALRNLRQLPEARAKIDAASALIEENPSPISYLEAVARHALERGMIEIAQGEFDAAVEDLHRALGAKAHLTAPEELECLGALAVLAYTRSEIELCEQRVAESEALEVPAEIWNSGFAAPLYTAQLLLCIDQNDVVGARAVERKLTPAAQGNHWDPSAKLMSAYICVLVGDPIGALDWLNQLRSVLGPNYHDNFIHGVSEVLRADILASLGHGDESFTILSRVPPGERHVICPARFIAQVRLGHGDLQGASDALLDCEELGDGHSPRSMIAIHLLRGAIEFERGNFAASDLNVDRAFHGLVRTGIPAPLRHIPDVTLVNIAARALTRPQSAEASRMLQGIVDAADGTGEKSEALSERERLVLTYVEKELTVAAIAAELYISPNTVKTHLRRLYRKLGVTTRQEAIRTARALGLHHSGPEVTPESPAQQDD